MGPPGESVGEKVGERALEAVQKGWATVHAKHDRRSSKQPPLLLLPGTLCDARVFEPLLDRLPRRDARMLSLSGGTSTTKVAERLLAQAPPRFALAGFSLGGIVALEMAALAPDRLAGLALLNTNPLVTPEATHPSRRAATAEAARHGLKAYVRQSLWPHYVAPGALDRDDLSDLLADMAEAMGPAVFALQTEVALSRSDRRAALGRLASPILLLTGEQDGLCPPAILRELAGALPRARLAILAGAGHFALLEAPDAVALNLARWLHDIDTDEVGAGASLDRSDRRRL